MMESKPTIEQLVIKASNCIIDEVRKRYDNKYGGSMRLAFPNLI